MYQSSPIVESDLTGGMGAKLSRHPLDPIGGVPTHGPKCTDLATIDVRVSDNHQALVLETVPELHRADLTPRANESSHSHSSKELIARYDDGRADLNRRFRQGIECTLCGLGSQNSIVGALADFAIELSGCRKIVSRIEWWAVTCVAQNSMVSSRYIYHLFPAPTTTTTINITIATTNTTTTKTERFQLPFMPTTHQCMVCHKNGFCDKHHFRCPYHTHVIYYKPYSNGYPTKCKICRDATPESEEDHATTGAGSY